MSRRSSPFSCCTAPPRTRASRLAFLLWPDSGDAQARTNLRKLVHHLRRTLPYAERFLADDGPTLQWRPDAPWTFDVADFEGAVAHAAQADQVGGQAAARAALEQAVAHYQGPLLPSCYDDWLLPERERLEQVFLAALERLIRLVETAGDHRHAIGHAQRLLRHDPLHEATYQQLMRLHAWSGDRTGALRVYRTCTTVLARELGVAPSAATREVYERLLQGESLRPSTPDGPLLPSGRRADPHLAAAVDQLHRARTCVSGGQGPARQHAAADAHRIRRERQNAPGAEGGAGAGRTNSPTGSGWWSWRR